MMRGIAIPTPGATAIDRDYAIDYLPFNQFVREQLAGDLFPSPDDAQPHPAPVAREAGDWPESFTNNRNFLSLSSQATYSPAACPPL